MSLITSTSRDDEPDGIWIKKIRQGTLQWRRADEEPQEQGGSSNSLYLNNTTQLLSDHFLGRSELSGMYQEISPELEAITWNSPAFDPQYGYTSGQPVMYQMPVPVSISRSSIGYL